MTSTTEFKKILVPIDFSDASQPVLDYAVKLAKREDASVDLLFVWELPAFAAPDLAMTPLPWAAGDLEGNAVKQGKEELAALVEKVNTEGLRIRMAVELGTPARSIARYAEREGVDLIVMGTHGRSGVERLFLGSVAQRVVAAAPCPVLTINAYDATLPRLTNPGAK